MVVNNSTYPSRVLAPTPLATQYGLDDDPSVLSSAVLTMMPHWEAIEICVGGTKTLRAYAERIIPREPSEAKESYERRVFHATMPPFLNRLASQAAGIILRKGIHIEGDDYWQEWIKDVTGDGTTLNEYARRQLVTALLYGHSSTVVDYANDTTPRTLAEERRLGRKPYLVPISPGQVLGWRTANDSNSSELRQVRVKERVITDKGSYGEELVDQIRVMEPGRYELWRAPAPTPNGPAPKWELHRRGSTSVDRIPMVTVYANRTGNLMSVPPLEEVAYLCIAYAQRFCDFHHSIHVGANPMLVLRGFDPDTDSPIGISVNTALLMPVDGGAEWVQPTTDAFEAQLKCLKELEDQIGRLGVNTLSQANMTNAAAEARRIDRIDSDSIMAVISGDLERTIAQIFELAAEYVGIEPPTVSIPRDYENRLIDGNQITAYLQLYMQNAISQQTLLKILQDGEVLPPTVDLDEELSLTAERLEEQQAMERLTMSGPDMAFQNAGQGESLDSQTLPTPMRPGRNAS